MHDINLINLNMMFARHDSIFDRQVYFPIGILTLTGVLERLGYTVGFMDYQLTAALDLFSSGSLNQWYIKQRSHKVPYVGLSCMSNLLPFAVLAARDIKKSTCAQILMGGAGPAGVSQEMVDSFYWVDAAFKGEAEESLPAYLSDPNGLHPGVSRAGIPPLPSKRAKRLDELPLLPDIVSRHYPKQIIRDDRVGVSMITSRGCPYKCTFCTIDAGFNFGVESRSVDSVVEEVKRWNALGKRVILFQDDIFTRNKSRVSQLCTAFSKLPFKFHWKCFGHVNHVNRELLELMASAGCIQIRYGIESGSDDILRSIDKRFTIEKALSVVKMSCDVIPSVHVSFIYGFPGETDDDFEVTVSAAKACRAAGATVMTFMLSPLPATKIYQTQSLALDYEPRLTPEYVSTGHEVVFSEEQIVLDQHRYVFDFIAEYPKVFPGFYHYDYQTSIRPKVKRLIEEDLRFMNRRPIEIDGYVRVDL